MKTIIMNATSLKEVTDLLRDERKINAIKVVRTVGVLAGGSDSDYVDLRHAKHAVEHWAHTHNMSVPYTVPSEGWLAKLQSGPVIKEMILDFGDEEIKVDLENMEMIALSKLGKMGLEACGNVLDLVKILKAFSNGEKVEIIKN